ncbi:MAG TPA: flagella assembly protein FlgT middle domain-containing protein [Gallionella sp.]|nr:flagella assembly protein FlgT middle domain-containing protein [Gallionella sp.]
MPIIIRKGFRFADLLVAVFCMMICAAPIAAAQVEGAEGGQDAARAPAAKKKIALVQFDVANTQHVDDISNIYDGLPLALASRLEASGEFLTAYTGRSIPAEAGEAQREAITQIAGEAGAQFLISGMVVNAGVSREKGYLGTSIGGYTKRHIEVELAVYDGLTGARLLLRRLDEQAQGDVRVGNDKPFGSSIFFETELGKATNRLLDLAVKDMRAALENVPFSAHIIRVEGKKIFLDAGSDSRLKTGDQLVIYVRDATPIVGLKGAALGVTDRAADTVTLTQVQPQFSSGELSDGAAKLGIKAGNLASIDPAEQRILIAKQWADRQAKDEAERVKAEQAAQAEAARVKAEQATQSEAARIKAEKKAAAQAKAQAAAEAKAAKLKAAHEARAARLSAAQEARAREKVQAARAADRARREAAKAKAARIKAEKKVQAAAETKAGAVPKSTKEKTTQKSPARMEVRAVAIEDLQREAAEAEAAKAEAAAGTSPERKPGVPLKLKQIKP